MRSLAILFLALVHFIALPAAAGAQDQSGTRVVSVESWVEEWDEASQRWVRVEDGPVTVERAAERFEFQNRLAHPANLVAEWSGRSALDGTGRYGPFQVLDENRAALVGTTDRMSPAQFSAMLEDHPAIALLELVEAPGTRDDVANLQLGRMIREAGISTYVPENGSVRSGAVELFLAGQERLVADGAEFAVHSWRDNYGREPDDYAPDAPENRLYLDYYAEMGMSAERARQFYDMTNSVPHSRALWLGAEDMRPWIEPEAPNTRARHIAPLLAYADVLVLPELAASDTKVSLARLDSSLRLP